MLARIQRKLDAAFMELTAKGYVAKQRFQCCCSCADEAISNLVAEELSDGANPNAFRGFVYYTEQDAEAVDDVNAESIYLNYGSIGVHRRGHGHVVVGDSPELTGRVIQSVLRRVGLRVEWTGDPSDCIVVFVR